MKNALNRPTNDSASANSLDRYALFWPASARAPSLCRYEGRIEPDADAIAAILLSRAGRRFRAEVGSVFTLFGLGGASARLPCNLHHTPGRA